MMNIEREKKAIERLRAFEPETEPYYLCYSGGKDSDAIRILAALAGVKHDIVHNHTTVDAPETVYYVRSIPEVQINYPEKTMWQLIVQKMIPPTRLARYCCMHLKERGGMGRVRIIGVRWSESARRKENGGVVKIIGKPKTVQKIAAESDALYSVNNLGGIVMNDDNAETRRVWDCVAVHRAELLKHYDMQDNAEFILLYKLRQIGVDVEKWTAEPQTQKVVLKE